MGAATAANAAGEESEEEGVEAYSVPGVTDPVQDCDSFEVINGKIKVECFSPKDGTTFFFLEAVGCVEGMEHQSEMKEEFKIVTKVNRCVFTGNSIFIGGCEKNFENNHMLKAMDIMLGLPNDTKMFCGHEYTKKNLDFCLKADPLNNAIPGFAAKYNAILDGGGYSVPSVLRDEK